MSKDSTDYPDLYSGGWQAELDRIISDNSHETAAPEEWKYRFVFDDTKLLWVLASSGDNPDGEWSEVRKLNVTDYIREALSGSNLEEYKIGMKLSEFLNRISTFKTAVVRNTAEAILPLLIGSNRVLDEDGNEKTVRSEQPAVWISVDGDHLTVSSNVTSELPACGGVDECNVEFDGKTYWVLHPDNTQREVLKVILKQRKYPLTAVGRLLAFAKKCNHIISIDVSALDNITSATPVQGDGRLILRMKVDRTDRKHHIYDIEAQSEPLRGSRYRYTPGEGPMTFVDNGYIVSRDDQAELDSYDKLSAFLDTIKGKKQSIDNPNVLLSLLEFVHDNPDRYEMEWPDGEEIKFGGTVSKDTWQTFVSTGTLRNWFDIAGNFSLPGQVIPIQQMIESAANSSEEDEYVKVGENEYF